MDLWASLIFVCFYVHGQGREALLPIVRQAMQVFKENYTSFFGSSSINLNVHLFSHLLDVHQDLGDLNAVSAVRSESLYQTFLRCFKAGTRSVAAQALGNVYFKYLLTHSCERRLKHRAEETSRTQDNYIFTEQFKVFRVINVGEDNDLVCHEVVGDPFVYKCINGPRLNFSSFGVFKQPFHENMTNITVPLADVRGKVVKTLHYCVCVTKETLLGGYY